MLVKSFPKPTAQCIVHLHLKFSSSHFKLLKMLNETKLVLKCFVTFKSIKLINWFNLKEVIYHKVTTYGHNSIKCDFGFQIVAINIILMITFI